MDEKYIHKWNKNYPVKTVDLTGLKDITYGTTGAEGYECPCIRLTWEDGRVLHLEPGIFYDSIEPEFDEYDTNGNRLSGGTER